MPNNTDDTDRAGVYLSGYRVTVHVGIFREQPASDYGVDAQVEFKEDGSATGQIVGVQIKTGPSYFAEPESTPDGWRFRPSKRHIGYWLRHPFPVYLLLVDLGNESIYWQELSERNFDTGPNGGILVRVPRAHTIETARAKWIASAESFAAAARDNFDDNLTRLAPSCVRTIERLAEIDLNLAELLAARFARGRAAPKLTIQSLLDNEPAWLSAAGASEGLAALAEYAHSHGLSALAIRSLTLAAERDPSTAERRLRVAGLLQVDSDREAGRAFLTRALELPGGRDDVHVEIGLAVADHPAGDAGPISLSPSLRSRIEGITDDQVVLSFLATQDERVGDMDAAVRRFELALELEPDSAQLMSALANALARRARTTASRPGDRDASIALAEEAIDQLHEWSGPTEGALDILLQAQMSAGRFAGALDRALPSPDGRALPNEALRPSVRGTASTAAFALGRYLLAQQILDAMPAGVDRDLAVARTRQGDRADQEAAWMAVLNQVDETHPEALVMAVMGLGELGVDKSESLSGLTSRHIIPDSLRTTVAETAAAVHSLDELLPTLRIRAESDEVAAHRLVQLLLDAGRYADAEAAASVAFDRFHAIEFMLLQVSALQQLGQEGEVEALLETLIANPELDPINRQSAHRQLAELLTRRSVGADAAQRRDLWQRIERHFLQTVYVNDVPVQERDVWLLVDAQVRLDKLGEAFNTFQRFTPEIETSGEARLWFLMTRHRTLTVRDFERMLDLAEQFADDVQVSAGLLAFVTTRTRDESDEFASPVDHRVVLNDDARARAFALLRLHVERHGEASPIQVLTADTPAGLISLMTDMVRRDNTPLIQLVEMIRQVRLPFGFLSLWLRRPYSSSLAERALGYTLAASAIDDDLDSEEAALTDALGGDVVVDISTLMVATELTEFESFRGQFRRVLLTEASKRDILHGRSELDGRSSSSGFMGYDQSSDSLVASEVDVEELVATLQRFRHIEAASNAPTVVPDASLSVLSDIAIEGGEAWLGPIAYAKHAHISLWSDDVGQRRLAHAAGVPAFSTLSLLSHRNERRITQSNLDDDALSDVLAVAKQEVVKQLEARIVDVRVDIATLVELADRYGWPEWLALITVGRPGWWHMSPNAFSELRDVLAQVDGGTERTEQWRRYAMWGAVRLAEGDPMRQATLLAAVAMTATRDEPSVDEVVNQLHAAEQTATQARIESRPTSHLEAAVSLLRTAGAWTPSADFVSSVNERMPSPGGA